VDFLLELLTEEIPARMQAAAVAQLVERFTAGVTAAALPVGAVDSAVTPRRLVLIVRDVSAASAGTSDERRGPRADAPEGAIAGFLKSTGLTRDALEERDTPKGRFLYATVVTEGRPAADILADLIPQIVRDFDWPKSMRWGDASVSTASPRWVRPLAGIVALLGDEVVPFEAAGVASGRTTFGHRFLSSGPVEIARAATYADQLRTAHVMLDPAERAAIIVAGAEAAATAAGLSLIPDAGLVAENAGLTERPVPLLGRFDPAFLDVPREVIQLTMRTNQKYFACVDAGGALAPAFVAVANLPDSTGAIVAGNQKVLAARLADAKFFWDADRAVTLESRLPKLADIVFHEKLGTVADKVERVAKLARWLVESGAVKPDTSPTVIPANAGTQSGVPRAEPALGPGVRRDDGDVEASVTARLADLAETAARLCKADLVSATVGEFPEVQGIAGGHLALAEGLDPQIAAAIRDHYKPVGPSDDVPTAPVTVAVALADKLDTLLAFFCNGIRPTGSKDPFALRRAALSSVSLMVTNNIHASLLEILEEHSSQLFEEIRVAFLPQYRANLVVEGLREGDKNYDVMQDRDLLWLMYADRQIAPIDSKEFTDPVHPETQVGIALEGVFGLLDFLADRLKVQQREAGIRPDVIDAVFSLGGEDDLVRLVARAKALQAVLQAPDGVSLLAGYRRGANIVRIEEGKEAGVSDGAVESDLLTEPAEIALNAALDEAVPAAAAAVAAEDFTGAMTALARLRPAVDAFFEHVTVNAHEQEIRRNRLALLARLRTAVHSVADFSKLDG
jgi:glycyl-tRNA synthetase beta chain